MHIAVNVSAGDPREGHIKLKTTHCIIVYVAIDETGSPTRVPKWSPRPRKDKALKPPMPCA